MSLFILYLNTKHKNMSIANAKEKCYALLRAKNLKKFESHNIIYQLTKEKFGFLATC